MKDNNTDFAIKWLKKAKNDIITAKQALKAEEPPTDAVCFHSQQAIEKSLKAFLTINKIDFPKTHDLLFLLNLCGPLTTILKEYENALSDTTNYAVNLRYPEDFSEPSIEEAEIAIKIAIEIFNIINSGFSDNTLF